jgi:dCTP deaminase
MIATLAEAGAILPESPFAPDQIQPASLDLRLGEVAYRVRASFLPGPDTTVAERIDALKLHEFELGDGAVLETGCVYIVPAPSTRSRPAITGRSMRRSARARFPCWCAKARACRKSASATARRC